VAAPVTTHLGANGTLVLECWWGIGVTEVQNLVFRHWTPEVLCSITHFRLSGQSSICHASKPFSAGNLRSLGLLQAPWIQVRNKNGALEVHLKNHITRLQHYRSSLRPQLGWRWATARIANSQWMKDHTYHQSSFGNVVCLQEMSYLEKNRPIFCL